MFSMKLMAEKVPSLAFDVPQEEDEEEVDTYWFCVVFEKSEASWDRYCSPAEGADS